MRWCAERCTNLALNVWYHHRRQPHRPSPLSVGSEPPSHHHVGSIRTAYGAHSRCCSPQCCQQNSFGTTPGSPSRPAPAPASLDDFIHVPATSARRPMMPIDTVADELGDTALCLYLHLRRGSWLFLEEQRPPRRRHHLLDRLCRMVPPPLWR